MTTPPENTGAEPPPVNPDNPMLDIKSVINGASPRPPTPKAWNSGKPPGGRLPPGPTAQDKSTSPPDKPAK